jgi:hypothetical protein
VARLRAFADDGASRAYLRVLDLDDLEHLDLLAADVAPPAVLTTSPDRSTCDQLRPLRITVMKVSVAEHVEST